MSEKYETVVQMIDAWWGGAATTIIAAIAGRLMWHTSEARKQRRRFFGIELVWELPMAVGMALIGEGVCHYLEAGPMLRPAIVGGLAYLGPRGAEVLFMRIIASRFPSKQ